MLEGNGEIIFRPYIDVPLQGIPATPTRPYRFADSDGIRRQLRPTDEGFELTVTTPIDNRLGADPGVEQYTVSPSEIIYASGRTARKLRTQETIQTWSLDATGLNPNSDSGIRQEALRRHLVTLAFAATKPENRPNLAGQGGVPYDTLFAAQGNR